MTLGAGACQFGSLHCGFGTPDTIKLNRKPIFTTLDGAQADAAYINPQNGQYIVTPSGNLVGQNSIDQQVVVALRTLKNSTLLKGFGLDLDFYQDVINDSVIGKVKIAIQKALQYLIDNQSITLQEINVQTLNSKVEIYLSYINLKTFKTHNSVYGLSTLLGNV